MKYLFLVAAVASLFFIACDSKGVDACTPREPAAEDTAFVRYNALHGYAATKLPSGMYYQIVDPGTGAVPTATSNVRVNYEGRRIKDDSTFDKNTSLSGLATNLSSVISGWTTGVPLIKSGGTIRLMIPSKFGYGCIGSGTSIPPNTPLFFEIKLLAVY